MGLNRSLRRRLRKHAALRYSRTRTSLHQRRHVHKTLGLATLVTFVLVLSGVITPRPFHLPSLLVICPALALALSSFIFHVPLKAPRSNKIHVEYRLHTVIFSLRSILIYLTHWAQFSGHYALALRLGLVMICHYCADCATRAYFQAENGTTIRGDISEIPS